MNNEPIGNKRQRLSSDGSNLPQEDASFLGFDYDFTNNAMLPQQQNTLPDNFFMFVSDTMPHSTGDPSIISPSTNVNVQPHSQSITPPHLPKRGNNDEPANEAVYTLIVGGRTFRLSWESLNSDGPINFFVEFFRKNNKRIMHIDRDPDIFELVARHLRGYYVRPVDDVQNRSLLYDANYYGLNRLVKFLHDFLYINVGGRVFCVPWSLFQKDGKHNFFTGPLMHSLLLPQIEDKASPPVYIDRDPDIFEDIINHLRGYTIYIRDEMHRKNLLRDAQYYVFRQLSDKLLTSQQTVAGFGECNSPEVLLLLQDIRIVNMLPSKAMIAGISHTIEEIQTDEDWNATQVQYKRVIEGPPHALLTQIGDISVSIHQQEDGRIIKLKYDMNEQDMKKMNNMAHVARATQGVNQELYIDRYCAISIDDQQVPSIPYCIQQNIIETRWENCTQCGVPCQASQLILQRAICSVHLINNMISLCAVRLEAISSRYKLNLKRQFLSG